MDTLQAISPIDGRYRKHTELLARFFSEAALIRYRIVVEGEYLIALSEFGKTALKKLSAKEKSLVRSLYNLSLADAGVVRDIEFSGWKEIKATNHDVKAVEYFLKDRLGKTSLKDRLEWIHFGLTSYDINTPARAMMLRDALEEVILPAIQNVYAALEKMAKKYGSLPMLARTHGQPASPTTFGKELKVFSQRLRRQIEQLKKQSILVKFSGATGNWNAHAAAYPKNDWIKFSKKFVAGLSAGKSIKLELNLPTTQIDPHDSEAEIFDSLRRINTILLGLNQDIWRYISDEWIVQKAVEGEIGSSAMPHKVNPIKFENSEGNLGMANAFLNYFSNKLPVSRLQRDLSDSTVERNYGVALAHCLTAYNYLLSGLSGIEPSEAKMREDLVAHPEVIAEAIQTILRREGAEMPYEKLKALTRGRKVTTQDFVAFIDSLAVSYKVKKELKAITPQNYTGFAAKLVK